MSRSPELETKAPIQVVVLVLENHQGDILITQRQKHQHLAGYWEFPGGKIESLESKTEALKRECIEELNYQVKSARQILQINHDYPTISVELSIFHEVSVSPQVNAAENQRIKWVNKAELSRYKLPEANLPIIRYFAPESIT